MILRDGNGVGLIGYLSVPNPFDSGLAGDPSRDRDEFCTQAKRWVEGRDQVLSHSLPSPPTPITLYIFNMIRLFF